MEGFLTAFLTREGWKRCQGIDLVAGMVMNISFVKLKSELCTHEVHFALKIVWTVLCLGPQEIIQCSGILVLLNREDNLCFISLCVPLQDSADLCGISSHFIE